MMYIYIIKKNMSKIIKENFYRLTGIEVKKNFLLETVNISQNNSSMIPLNEISVDRLLGKHYDAGFIIISASRNPEEASNHENNEKTKELANDIRNKGYSYMPVYGGFIENVGSDNEKEVYESSFLIFNFDRKGEQLDYKDLYDFGLELTNKYQQESFLSKEPGGSTKFITGDNKVDGVFNGDIKINDLADKYFTSLVKTKNMDSDQDNRRDSRFSFTKTYINPRPVTYNERIMRDMKGEIFLNEYIKKYH